MRWINGENGVILQFNSGVFSRRDTYIPYIIYKKSILNSLRKLEYVSFYKATQHMLLDIVDDDF